MTSGWRAKSFAYEREAFTMTPVLTFHRRLLRTAAAVLAAAALAGCGATTQTPASQDARLTKAAGVSSLSLVLPDGLWKQTRGSDDANDNVSKVNGEWLDDERGARGLVRVSLTGAQVVDYMKYLDRFAHPGWADPDGPMTKEAATRVYNALGSALDGIKGTRKAGDPVPEVLVDDAPTPAVRPR
jgi:hypothetical protein